MTTYYLTEIDGIPLAFRWSYRDFWWGDRAWVWSAGLKATVTDYDGDRSDWIIETRDGEVLRQGEDDGAGMYHFDACLIEAGRAMKQLIAERQRGGRLG